MDDLISRQDVVELAMQYCPDNDGTCSKADEDIRNLLDELEDLPSAQPEIIRCKDCKHWYERQGRMYCGEMYFDQDDPDFYCGYAEGGTDDGE